MPNPPDTDPGSLDVTDAKIRRVATPPESLPPRLPSVPVRRPSRKIEAANDVAVTTRVERLADPDPAPLPPSPAAADADRWLQRARPQLDAPVEVSESSDQTTPVASSPPVHPVGHSSLFTALLAITMLVIGMVLGALIFR